jgi:hypothetical protein
MKNFEIRFLLYYANLKKSRDENEPSFIFKDITVYILYPCYNKPRQTNFRSGKERKQRTGNKNLWVGQFKE